MSEMPISTPVESEVVSYEPPAARPRRSLLWGTKWAGIQVAWQFAIKIGRGLIIPKLLDPANYGLFTSLGVLLSYTQHADAGVKYQLAKRLPYELGRNGEEGYRHLAGKGATWILATSIAAGVACVAASFFQHGEHAWFYRPALLLLGLLVVFSKVRDFLGTALISREEFRAGVLGNMIVDGVALVACVAFLLLWGVLGAVLGLIASELAGTVYYLGHLRFRPERIDLGSTWNMIREGVLLLGVALMDTALMTVDQLFLLRFFPKEQFGIYSLGLFVASVALSISGILLTTMQPRVMALEGEGQRERVHGLIDSGITLYLLALIPFLAAAVPGVSVIVRFYLPKYQAGIPVYVLLGGLALVRGPAILLRPFYISRNQEKKLMMFQVLAISVAALLNALVVLRHLGIAYVAMASFSAYAVISLLMLVEFERLGTAGANLGKYVILIAGAAGVVAMYLYFAEAVFPEHFLAYTGRTVAVGGTFVLVVGMVMFLSRRSLQRAAQPYFSK